MAIGYLSALNTKGSGLNITQIVDSLVDADVMPKKDALNKQIKEKNTQISALSEVVADLSSLQSDMKSLANTTQLVPTSASTASLSIAVTDSALAKEFTADVKVEALATAQTLYFNNSNFTSPSSTVGSGNIAVQTGTWDSDGDSFTASTTQNISIADGTTLTTFASQLNALTGVNASVLNVGNDTYALVIKSELGSKNAINMTVSSAGSVSGTKTSLESFDTAVGNSIGADGVGTAGEANSIYKVAATDAHLKVDGVSIYRETNAISDLFDGYTVTPKTVNTTSFRVQSTTDVDTAFNTLSSLVSSVNITKALFKTLTDRENDGALSDDPVIASIERQLDGYFNGGIEGFFGSALYMSELGVSTNRDGSISLSETKFRDAMAVEGTSTIAGGSKLFNAVFNSSVYSDDPLLKVEKSSYIEPTAGVYAFAQDGSSDPPTATIAGSGTGVSTYNSATAPYYTSSQTATAGLKITPSTTSSISGASLFVGTSLLDTISTYIDSIMASSGDLATRETALGNQLSDFEIELEDVEAKTDGIRSRYMSQFSAMESAVTSLKGTGDYLTNMIESWNSDS